MPYRRLHRARGKKAGALERVNWTGKVPFEIHTMTITKRGFKLEFTMPTDVKSIADIAAIKTTANTWIYQSDYGSPEVDIVTPIIESITLSPDGKTAAIVLDKIYKGHTYNFDFKPFKSERGQMPLRSDDRLKIT